MALKHILIAVPTMGGLMKAKTATTLVMLMRQLTRAGVTAEYLNVDSSDIVYARNLYARIVLNSKVLDGLLFVDSDMEFRPALVLRMLAREADVVGVAYPKRALNLEAFARAMAEAGAYTEEAKARALADTYHYTVIPNWEARGVGQLRIARGFAKMAAVGMGCALISKDALKAMIEGKVVERRKDIIEGVEQVGWGFFDCVKAGDVTLSEDFSFCHRWTRQLGRDLWVCVDAPVAHLGEFPFQTRFIDRLRPVQRPAEAAPPAPLDLDAEPATGS